MWSSMSGRTIIIVSGEVKFIGYLQGITTSGGVKVKRSPIVSEYFDQ